MHKPPPEPQPLSLTIRDLALKVPTVVALLAIAGVLGLATSSAYRLAVPEAPPPLEQQWTGGSGNVATMTADVVRRTLPDPDPRQRRPPCDPDVGEEAINGACWIRLSVEKCNTQKAFEHNGKCYWRALRPEPLPRSPTSGEGRPVGVAGGAE